MLSAKRLGVWTKVFLATTTATSVTGFFFPVDHFLPSHAVGIVSLIVLALAISAHYRVWRRTYAIAALIALYLNVFVLIAQLFLKVPSLKALAPTQSDPPFQITQLVVLVLFFVLGILAAIKFPRTGPPVPENSRTTRN